MNILAIDPGTTQSAFVQFGVESEQIKDKGVLPNFDMITLIQQKRVPGKTILVIEKVASFGMSVGATVFETVFWSGRFAQAWSGSFDRITRMEAKIHICHNSRAKDKNIRAALIERYGNPGTKKEPGKLYGVKSDIWAALAVAVTYADKLQGRNFVG